MEAKLKEYLEGKIWYDLNSTHIWVEKKKEGCQHLADVRDWGAIQHLFKDQNEAGAFQDSVGEFIASAIREKIERESSNSGVARCSCGTNLIWGGDHDYEDYGIEGDGIVSNHSCPNEDCDVETVFIHTNS